jgi:hypothetical protein
MPLEINACPMDFTLYFLEVLRVAGGILAIQDPSHRVQPRQAIAYADAAIQAARARRVDVWELVGVARNESRFRADEIGPDGKDCGIMQTRTTGSRYSCRRLRNDVALGFAEGARELAGYAAMCKRHPDYDRCRFNRYNSGVHYAKRGWNGRYWLRVLCYTQAARQGATGARCQAVETRREIARSIGGPRPGLLAVGLLTETPSVRLASVFVGGRFARQAQ